MADLTRAPLSRRLVDIVPGQKLGRYQVLSEIGHGGMATVFEARDLELDRVVALKILPSSALNDDRFVSRFLQEARTVARMSHPSIVQVHDIGQAQGIWYISMERIHGQNLADYLHQEKPDLQKSVQIAAQVAEAVAYAHQHGIMHRDIKPSNVLMRGDHPVVIDFGLAKDLHLQAGAVLTTDGEMIGSPAYMSPEQAQGHEVDITSDVCSLGILLYELISFTNPYLDPRSVHQTVMNVMAANPVPIRRLCSWVDKDLAAVVHMAMNRDKGSRYPNMTAFAADLRAWLAGKKVQARTPGLGAHLKTFASEHTSVLWMAGAMVLMLLAAFAYLKLQERLGRTPWAIFVEETFDSPKPSITFESFRVAGTRTDPIFIADSSWGVRQGRLEGQATGLTFCRSTQDFMGNLRVEFDVQGMRGSNHDFNIFLYGDNPQQGVRFFLGQWGSQRSGIETGNSRYHWLSSRFSLSSDRTYHVSVERDGQRVRLLVDGQVLDERTLVLPPNKEGGYRLGFFTWNGAVAIDNIKVSRRTVALRASPNVVADAFLDEGFLDHAVNSYHAVVQSYPNYEVAQQARLKLGTIAMARNQYKQALELFSGVANDPRSRSVLLDAVYLQSIAEQAVGNLEGAQRYQERLVKLDRKHPANVALIQNQLERIESCLDMSQPMFYGCASDGEQVFRFLAQVHEKRQSIFGPTHVRFMEALRLWGGVTADTSFLHTAFQFDKYYERKSPEVAAEIHVIEGKRLRDQRQNERAMTLLRETAEGANASKAPDGAFAAMIELGRTAVWDGRPGEGEDWFRKVVDADNVDTLYLAQAQLEWGIAAILAGVDGGDHWKAILDMPSAPWLVRQQAAFLSGKIDSAGLRQAMHTPEGLNPEFPLYLALGALQRRDYVQWHAGVDDFVRRYPYSSGLWEIRRVVEWAAKRTPRS